MKITELNPGKVPTLEGTITSLGQVQATPQGVPNCEGVLSDDEDQVKIVLWEKQVDEFKAGDKVRITSGFCKEFPQGSGQLQVSTGKFGKIVKL